MERRLAAVLIADVVGYSSLSQKDEEGTRANFRADLGEVFEPKIAAHHGRLIKTMGDGVLVEFSSVVDAVRCAFDIQRNKVKRNTGVATPLVYRIGINLGDIMIEGNDIHGDGVNIADRIQGLADHGGIAISGAAYDQVKSKVDIGFAFLGERELKNIADPVRLYRVVLNPAETPGTIDRAAASRPGRVATGAGSSASRLSIAILPFANMSGDKEQDYFSDGITEDIITEISRFKELHVIGRNSSFAFRGQNLEIKEIAAKLGVQFIVEGSVRKSGNRIRVTAQLIESATDRHVWAERYDRSLDDIFAIQDEIARTIATIVAGHVSTVGATHSKTRPTENLNAYDLVLRTRALFTQYTPYEDRIELAMKAVELDPNYAMAHAVVSHVLITKSLYDADLITRERAAEYARRAITLDPDEPWGHAMLALCLMFLKRMPEAGSHFERALQLNPNEGNAKVLYGLWHCFSGRVDEAVACIEDALKHDPFGHEWYWDDYCIVLVAAERYEEAIAAYDKMVAPAPWSYAFVAIAKFNLGDVKGAKEFLARFETASKVSSKDLIYTDPWVPTLAERLLADLNKIAQGT
jgi:adenylate cyclase